MNRPRLRWAVNSWHPSKRVVFGARIPRGEGALWGGYFDMPRHASGRYSQRYSQGFSSDAAASWSSLLLLFL